jgi:glutaredoxin-like YruB-family protein
MAKVIIYSTPTCVYCKMAKDFLTKNNIAFDDRNVAIDLASRKEMFDKSHQMGVPVMDIDGEIIVGFDKDTIKNLLKI